MCDGAITAGTKAAAPPTCLSTALPLPLPQACIAPCHAVSPWDFLPAPRAVRPGTHLFVLPSCCCTSTWPPRQMGSSYWDICKEGGFEVHAHCKEGRFRAFLPAMTTGSPWLPAAAASSCQTYPGALHCYMRADSCWPCSVGPARAYLVALWQVGVKVLLAVKL